MANGRNPGRSAFPLLAGAGSTAILILLLIINPVQGRVHAADLFGTLRAAGEPAFIAGHRGDRSAAPENTIPAIQRAVDELDYVETDVVLTKDGVPVLMHDATVDRTTDGTGAVESLTAAQVRQLDAGSWFSPKFAGTPVPTLAEAIAVIAPSGATLFLELKGRWTPEGAKGVADLIGGAGLGGRVIVASFVLSSLSVMESVAPGLPRAAIMRELPEDPVEMASSFGVMAIMVPVRAVEASPGVVDELHQAGVGIVVYTLNSKKRWQEAIGLGVDGIVTDKPTALDTWLTDAAPNAHP